MSKYLMIGALGFCAGMKYRQLGKRRCLSQMKRMLRRVTALP